MNENTQKAFEYLSFDGLDEPEPNYPHLFENALPTNCISLLCSKYNDTSDFIIKISASLATGRQVFDSLKPVNTDGIRVLYFEGETPFEYFNNKMQSCGKLFPDVFLDPKLSQNLYISANRPLNMVENVDGNYVRARSFKWVLDEVHRLKPQLIIFDSLVNFVGWVGKDDESKAYNCMSLFQVFTKANTSILFIHPHYVNLPRFIWEIKWNNGQYFLENIKSNYSEKNPTFGIGKTL